MDDIESEVTVLGPWVFFLFSLHIWRLAVGGRDGMLYLAGL